MNQNTITHASVFSGIGGPEVAAVMLGWQNLFHCEINPFGKAVLDYWFPNSKSYEDITKTDFTEWRGKVTVLTGGFPCQPFSYAGRRAGAEDDRYLWPYMFRCIDQIQPDWVVAENVAGILTMVEQGEVSEVASTADLFDTGDRVRGYRLRETFTLQRICDDLESHGYTVQPVLIPACAVGAPHRRDRVFIIGHRRDAADTADAGAESVRRERQDKVPGLATPTDTASLGGRQVHAKVQTRLADGNVSVRTRSKSDASNTTRQGLSRNKHRGEQKDERPADYLRRDAPGCYGTGRTPGQRWQGFPTVSAVHRGNDGLPFDVDDLTLPFGKWRTEALKAYGNAIVPQVMYEIFRAIDQIENN